MNEQQAEKLYGEFWGRDHKADIEIELGDMSNLTFLGRATAIEYKAKKHDDSKIYTYRHEFGKRAYLLTNGKDLVIYNPDMTIEDRGIVG